jgi:hypothetical protein
MTCSQLLWIFEQPAPLPEECSQTFLAQLLGRLAQQASHKGQHYFFAVDGFHNLSEEESGIAESIIKLLPWGSSRFFRFFITGPEGRIPCPRHNNARQSHISPFTLPETQEFFAGVVGSEEARTIYKDFNGWPSKLSNVRRLLVEADDPVQRLRELPKTDPGLFEVEWAKADKIDDLTTQLLAILAHETGEHTVRDLAMVADADVHTTYSKLEPFTFLEKRWPPGLPMNVQDIDSISQIRVDYVSTSFRQFALRQLNHLKPEVEERRIELLSTDLAAKTGTERVVTLMELTSLLEAKHRSNQLLELLKPESIVEILSGTHSLWLTQQRVQSGIDAAVHVGRDKELRALAVQKCALAELEDAFIGLPEIEAHLALGNYDTALKLARNAVLYEDRLHQLAIIAQAKHKRKLPIEEEVSGQIKHLCEEINAVGLGERAVDIASALLPTQPELALNLVERANQTSGENSLDWALARLSLSAIQKEEKQGESGVGTPAVLREKIQDPGAQRFTQMAALVYSSGQYSAREVIAQVNTLGKVGDQLFILRQWALNNVGQVDAALVIERGLEILSTSRDYIPNSRDLRHLASPLPSLEAEAGRPLLQLIRGLHETMLHRAVTVDDVVLRLLMAQAAWKWGETDARDLFNEIYLDTTNISDLGTRAKCLARLLCALATSDSDRKLETSDGIHTLTEAELSSVVAQLLDQTAEHLLAFRGILRPLARTHPVTVFDWIEQLNLGERRDLAYEEFVDAALLAPLDEIDFPNIEKALQRCGNTLVRARTIVDGLSVLSNRLEGAIRASRNFQSLAPLWQPSKAIGFITMAGRIEEVDMRCRGLCLASVILAQGDGTENNTFGTLIRSQLSTLRRDWLAIDSAWERTSLGYEIVSTLGKLDNLKILQDAAREFLKEVESQREALSIDHERPANAYFYCLSLAIRASAGMAATNNVTDAEKNRLAEAIESLPSAQKRLTLWSEWALRTYRNSEFFQWACTKGVAANFQSIKATAEKAEIERAVITAAPALFLFHQNTIMDELRGLTDADARDSACEAICRFLLHKRPESDPVQSKKGQSHPLYFREAIDICTLLRLVTSHATIHSNIGKIVDSALENKGEYAFTQENCQLLIQKISELIDERITRERKLTDTRQIRHDGYEVVCGIEVLRLKVRCKTAKSSDWDKLISQAHAIPNAADRAFVLCYLANGLRDSQQRRTLFEEVKEIVVQIPTTYDRLERYQFLVEMAEVTESALAKQYARTGFDEVMKDAKERSETWEHGSPPSHLYNRAQQFLDLIHGLSPELATTMAQNADDEPARKHLKTRLKYLDRKKKFENEKHNETDIYECSVSDWARMAWSLLAQLNAGRIEPWRRSETRDYIRVAARASLMESYPILSWTIENLVRRHGSTDNARDSLLPLFNAALSGVTIIRLASHRATQRVRNMRSAAFLSEGDDNDGELTSLSPQDRTEAFEFIDEWVQKNVTGELQICDGYLSVNDVCDLLRIIARHHPECSVSLLISEKSLGVPIEEAEQAFLQRWNNITNIDPPDTHIIVASTGAQRKSPVHDRYFLTESKGLTTGTSANGYALSVHSMAEMDEDHFQTMRARLEPFMTLRQRRQGTDTIRYSMVQLPALI